MDDPKAEEAAAMRVLAAAESHGTPSDKYFAKAFLATMYARHGRKRKFEAALRSLPEKVDPRDDFSIVISASALSCLEDPALAIRAIRRGYASVGSSFTDTYAGIRYLFKCQELLALIADGKKGARIGRILAELSKSMVWKVGWNELSRDIALQVPLDEPELEAKREFMESCWAGMMADRVFRNDTSHDNDIRALERKLLAASGRPGTG
jgi:hypothetical protein